METWRNGKFLNWRKREHVEGIQSLNLWHFQNPHIYVLYLCFINMFFAGKIPRFASPF